MGTIPIEPTSADLCVPPYRETTVVCPLASEPTEPLLGTYQAGDELEIPGSRCHNPLSTKQKLAIKCTKPASICQTAKHESKHHPLPNTQAKTKPNQTLKQTPTAKHPGSLPPSDACSSQNRISCGANKRFRAQTRIQPSARSTTRCGGARSQGIVWSCSGM